MKKTLNINITLAGAVVLLLACVGAWIAIPYCIVGTGQSSDIGPQAFPQIVSALCGVLCMLQILLVLIGKKPSEYRQFSLEVYGKVLLAMVLAVAVVFASTVVNVLFPAMACSLVYLVLLKAKDWRYYMAVLIAGGLLYALMVFGLNIRF